MTALKWLAAQGHAVKQVTPLVGLTACSRLIELHDGQKWVWRQQSEKATRYGVDYAQEFALLSALADLPFTPKPYVAMGDFSLLHWQEGEVPSAWHDALLRRLAEQLATLHTLDLRAREMPPTLVRLNLAERCQSLWERLPLTVQTHLPFQPPFEAVQPFASAVCHHDLHLGNLVEQGERLFLIDWEYAALSDPALDLALFLHANTLSAAQQALFFTTYFAKSGFERAACCAKIAEYFPLVTQLSQLWYAMP